MKITDLQFIKDTDLPQGSKEWLEVRSRYGMASEAAAVMCKSPWMPATPLQLWEVKTGVRKVFVSDAMKQGTKYEPVARESLEENMGVKFQPVVVLCNIDGVPIGASLDGYNKEKSIVAEIKIPMKGEDSKLWEIMTSGKELPDQYDLQTQQQLLVTGAKQLIFWVYDIHNHSAVMQKIEPNPERHSEIFKAWQKYYSYNGMPPAGEKDFTKRKDESWIALAEEWRSVHSQLDTLNAREKEIRQELIDLSEGKSCTGGGVRFKRSEGKGRISYAKIPALKDVDLEQYRGKPIIKYYLTEIKT
jgi:putative phage-type endonuclease